MKKSLSILIIIAAAFSFLCIKSGWAAENQKETVAEHKIEKEIKIPEILGKEGMPLIIEATAVETDRIKEKFYPKKWEELGLFEETMRFAITYKGTPCFMAVTIDRKKETSVIRVGIIKYTGLSSVDDVKEKIAEFGGKDKVYFDIPSGSIIKLLEVIEIHIEDGKAFSTMKRL